MNRHPSRSGGWRVAGLALLLAAAPALAAGDCPRIISQSPYISHTLAWLELDHCIVGASRYDRGDHPDTGGILDPDGGAIAALVAERQPDVVFSFTNDAAAACPVVAGLVDVRVATLPGSLFLHPAPVIIDGLKHLDAERTQWQPASP